MKAFITVNKGKIKIDLTDENNIILGTMEVTEIHYETGKENIEPVNRQFNQQRKMIKTGCFVH
jgi:hypothetical protein